MAKDQVPMTEFRARPAHLLPVVLVTVLSGVFALPVRLGRDMGFVQPDVTLFDESATGSSLNAIVFVVGLFAAAVLLYVAIRKGLLRFAQKLLRIALFTVTLSVTVWYVVSLYDVQTALLNRQQLLIEQGFVVGSAVVLAVLMGMFMFSARDTLRLVGTTIVGALTGIFLGASIPLLTGIFLALALVVYDIFAVFKGPVGAIFRHVDPQELKGAVYTYRELTIGMGDIVFYSLVAALALFNFGFLSFIGAATGILLGSYLSLRLLTRREVIPGLPISLLLGIGLMLLMALIPSP